jgi:hypothetical protein
MTPLDNYIRKNPPQHPFFRDLGSKLLVALSLTLAIACVVGIGFFLFIVPFWGISLAACFLMDRKTGKRALLGIPFVVPGIWFWFACLRWRGCDF